MTAGPHDVPRVVSARREIATSPERIFELIANPAQQPRWDDNVMTVKTPDGGVLGVVQRIAAHSPAGMTWGYAGPASLDCARSLLAAAWAVTASGALTAADASSTTSGTRSPPG